MLISCPSCPKVYRVPASAIPPEGRDVHCAACGEVWFERGVVAEIIEPVVHPELMRIEAAGEEAELAAKIFDVLVKDELPDQLDEQKPSASVPHTDQEVAETPRPQLLSHQPHIERPDPVDSNVSLVVTRPVPSPDPIRMRMGHAFRPAFVAAARSVQNRLRRMKERKQASDLPPGQAEAERYRARIRERNLNRLTPMRAIGWAGWAALLALMIGGVTQYRGAVERIWPRTSNFYAAFEQAPEALVRLSGVSVRYAQSLSGPVLELRGTLINDGTSEVKPELVLASRDSAIEFAQILTISEVPIPKGGERPFVIRAQVPEGMRTAALSVSSLNTAPSSNQQFVLQQTGSGWGESLPEMSVRRATSD